MRKGDIENVARILSAIKDSLDELDSALKSNNASRATDAKIKILDLQLQIRRIL